MAETFCKRAEGINDFSQKPSQLAKYWLLDREDLQREMQEVVEFSRSVFDVPLAFLGVVKNSTLIPIAVSGPLEERFELDPAVLELFRTGNRPMQFNSNDETADAIANACKGSLSIESCGLAGVYLEGASAMSGVFGVASSKPDGLVDFDESRIEGLLSMAQAKLQNTWYQRVLDRKQEQLAASEYSLRRFHQITTNKDLSLHEKIGELLDVGRQRLDVSYGFFMKVADGNQTVVLSRGDHEKIYPGNSVPLEKSYCRYTVGKPGVTTVENAEKEGWVGDPAYKEFGLACYAGTEVEVNGDVYGTFCFAGDQNRDDGFSESEQMFIEILADWVSFELGRLETVYVSERTEKQLKQILDLIPGLVYARGRDGTFILTNSRMNEYFNIDPDEVEDLKPEDIVSPESSEWEAFFGDAEQTNATAGQPTSREHWIESKQGRGELMEFREVPFEGLESEESGVLTLALDTTDAHRARHQLEQFFELSLDLLCLSDLDGYFKRVNQAFTRLLGYSEKELLNTPILEFVHPEDLDKTEAAMERVLAGEDLITFENRYKCKDGTVCALVWRSRFDSTEELVYSSARPKRDK